MTRSTHTFGLYRLEILAAFVNTLLLFGLRTVWQGAVQTTALHLQVRGPTLLTGACCTFAAALGPAWWLLRSQTRTDAQTLLSGRDRGAAALPGQRRYLAGIPTPRTSTPTCPASCRSLTDRTSTSRCT